MSYEIIVDSTCDLSPEFIKANKLTVIPMKYQIEGKDYINYPDHREMSHKDFFELLNKTKEAHTAQLNSEEIKEIYSKFLKEGKDILAIVFSSALSGSYNAVRLAVDELQEEYPKRKIICIDSLCASGGEGLLTYYAALNRDKGMSIEDNEKYILNLIPRLCHWFTITDIDLLRRGGRLSNGSAFMAKMLKINPVLHVSNEGKLVAIYKKIGRKQAIKQLIKEFLEKYDRSYAQKIFINQANCMEDAEYLKKQISIELTQRHIPYDNIHILDIGPVIGSHSGPGTLAIFFVGNKR